MRFVTRHASVLWTGRDKGGHGAVTTGSGVLCQTRFSSGTPPRRKPDTTPAELIAAAHAGSFSMALATELGSAGFVPNNIAIIATVTLEHLADGWTMTNINLKVLAQVPKAAQGDFIDATLRAKTGCPISRLLRANISINAKLDANPLAAATPLPPKPGGKLPARLKRPRRPKLERS